MKTWTPYEIGQVRSMVLTHNMTYVEIARHMNVSRNVIAGICSRHGIRHASKPERKRHIPKPKAKEPIAVVEHHPQKTLFLDYEPFQPAPKAKDVWGPLPGSKPIHLVDLGRNQCRFPVTDQIGLACGNHVREGVYCDEHRRVAYTTGAQIEHK